MGNTSSDIGNKGGDTDDAVRKPKVEDIDLTGWPDLQHRINDSLKRSKKMELEDQKRRDLGTPSLPERCWKAYGGAELEPALRSGAIVLLNAQWLVNFVYENQNKTLPRRQELPPEAFLSCDEVIMSSSHRGQIHIYMVSHM